MNDVSKKVEKSLHISQDVIAQIVTNSVNENNEGSKLVNNDDFVELLQFDEWKMFEPILHDNI